VPRKIDAHKLRTLMSGLAPDDLEPLRADIAYARDVLKADVRQFIWHNLEKRLDSTHDRDRIGRLRTFMRSLTSEELLWVHDHPPPVRKPPPSHPT